MELLGRMHRSPEKLLRSNAWIQKHYTNQNLNSLQDLETKSFNLLKHIEIWHLCRSVLDLAGHGAGGCRSAAVQTEARVGPADSQTLSGASCWWQVFLFDLQVGPTFHCWWHNETKYSETCHLPANSKIIKRCQQQQKKTKYQFLYITNYTFVYCYCYTLMFSKVSSQLCLNYCY